MGPKLIILVGFIYLYVAIEQFLAGTEEGKWTFIMYLGYAFSNIGLYKLAKIALHIS